MRTLIASSLRRWRWPRAAFGDDSARLLTIDHYVRVKSTVPAIAGQDVPIYVRERVAGGRRAARRVDQPIASRCSSTAPARRPRSPSTCPQRDYSWMAYLADAGFDVFAMDTTGYGRSDAAGGDERSRATSPRIGRARSCPSLIAAPCAPSYPHALTTIASDWNDIDGVVNYIRALRHVDKVSLLAWSLGGPRAGGYAAQHPEKVQKLVLLAPAYGRNAAAAPPAKMPPDGVPMNTQSREEFYANWDRQVGCPAQYEPAVGDAVWSAMLASDPVGATWGPGVRRAPQTATWGWNAGGGRRRRRRRR